MAGKPMKLETPSLQPLDDLVLLSFASDDDVFAMLHADLCTGKLAGWRPEKACAELLSENLEDGSQIRG